MLCDIEVQDTPTVVTDDEKAIERAEGDRRNSEEVHRGNRFTVITEKGKPAPGRLRISGRPSHPTRDRSGLSSAPIFGAAGRGGRNVSSISVRGTFALSNRLVFPLRQILRLRASLPTPPATPHSDQSTPPAAQESPPPPPTTLPAPKLPSPTRRGHNSSLHTARSQSRVLPPTPAASQ